MIACPAQDLTLGVAVRLATTLDCQARALGENGFEFLGGGPIGTACLSAAITIFVALIGYRLLLGAIPSLRDGVGWAIRLGIVLALATSWPAFQALVYRVAVDAPAELSATLLTATGMPGGDVDERLQAAYQTLENGVLVAEPAAALLAPTSEPLAGSNPTSGQPQPLVTALGFPASPLTASLLILSGIGLTAALRMAVGLLVALGPLAIVALLFDATLGIVGGWIRALAGAALAVLATSVAASLEVAMIEGEIARIRDIAAGAQPASAADPQAFVTIAGVFALVALVMTYVGFRAAAAFSLPRSDAVAGGPSAAAFSPRLPASLVSTAAGMRPSTAHAATSHARTRVGAVADAVNAAAVREQMRVTTTGESARRGVAASLRPQTPTTNLPLGQAGRRTSIRRTRAAANRDRGR